MHVSIASGQTAAPNVASDAIDPERIPNGGGGPGWGLGVAWLESGQVERARALLMKLGVEGTRTMPVERCFDWESLALVELASGKLLPTATE